MYEANDVTIKTRECLPRSTLESADGKYSFEGVTTTEAYCDSAISLVSGGATIIFAGAVLLASF